MQYLWDISNAVVTGQCSVNLSRKDPGTLNHSRYITKNCFQEFSQFCILMGGQSYLSLPLTDNVRFPQKMFAYHWQCTSPTDNVCLSHWQCMPPTDNVYFSLTKYASHWQCMSPTDNTCLPLTMYVSHWQCTPPNDNVRLPLTMYASHWHSPSDNVCLPLTMYINSYKCLFW